MDSCRDELLELRYLYNFSEFLKRLKTRAPFADGGFISKELKSSIETLLGPVTE
jgi:hypothetical protein